MITALLINTLKKMRNKHFTLSKNQTGFTLIELMVVIAILAAVAGTAATVLTNVDTNTQASMARVEIQNVAKAIRQFKQDTGYYPGQGPFSYWISGADCTDTYTAGGGINPDLTPSSAWLQSPANLGQLFTKPHLCANHPLSHLATWNLDTGRGWRGPYLTYEGLVDIGNGLNTDGSGSPNAGVEIANVPGVSDSFTYNEQIIVGTNYSECSSTQEDTANCVLEWRSRDTSSMTVKNKKKYYIGPNGRPYLLFFDGNGSPRIVSMGPNGRYDSDEDTPCTADEDDTIICIN